MASTVLKFSTHGGGWEDAALTLIYLADLIDAKFQASKRQYSFLGNCGATFHMIFRQIHGGKIHSGNNCKANILAFFLRHRSLDSGKGLWIGVSILLFCSCIPLLASTITTREMRQGVRYRVFSCTGEPKSPVWLLGEVIASVKLGTLQVMSVN